MNSLVSFLGKAVHGGSSVQGTASRSPRSPAAAASKRSSAGRVGQRDAVPQSNRAGGKATIAARVDYVIRPNGYVFHGWWMVGGAAGIQLLSGLLWMHSYSAYATQMHLEFGWSMAVIGGAFALTRVESGLLGPLQGWLVDRLGPRLILRIGLLVFALGFLAFAMVDSVLTYFLAWALIAIGSGLGGFATLTVAIVNWFDRHRSKAVAVSQLGFSLGGLCVPLVIFSLEGIGWRWTAAASALAILLIGLPLVQLVHHRPEAKGEVPDGAVEPHPSNPARRIRNDRDLTSREAMRTPAFWLISCGHALALLTVSAVMAHLVVHLNEGLQFTLIEAGFVITLMTACQMAGQLLGGWLGDRYDKRLLCVFCMLAHGAGFMLLAFASSAPLVLAFAVLHGLGWGVRGPLMVALRADYFGASSFGTIMGFSSLVAMLGMTFGSLFAGVMKDVFGDYVSAFAIIATLSGLGAVLFGVAKRPLR